MARILIVGDEVAIRKAAERFLKGLKYEVVTAKDGEEGMRCAADQSFDLALVDLVMPKMDGVEFIREIKKAQPAMDSDSAHRLRHDNIRCRGYEGRRVSLSHKALRARRYSIADSHGPRTQPTQGRE